VITHSWVASDRFVSLVLLFSAAWLRPLWGAGVTRHGVRCNIHRRRVTAWHRLHVEHFAESTYDPEVAFRQFYRMPREAFVELVRRLSDELERDAAMAVRSSGSPVTAEAMVSMTLRYLIGSRVDDICIHHAVHKSTAYQCVWQTCDAIKRVLTVEDVFAGTVENTLCTSDGRWCKGSIR
jgi:hypothetical protein